MGAAVIWSYIELYRTSRLSGAVFVDQAPLQVHIGLFLPRSAKAELFIENYPLFSPLGASLLVLLPFMLKEPCRRLEAWFQGLL
jgi:hypothetical protein